MIATEQGLVIPEEATSVEASGMIREFFQTQVGRLVEAGVEPHSIDGKEQFLPWTYRGDGEIGSEEYAKEREQRTLEGHVEWVDIRRSVETGRISSAEIAGHFPATLSEEEARGLDRADRWGGRFQFPAVRDSESPRVVLDTWRTPATYITLLAVALNEAYTPDRLKAYGDIRGHILNKDKSTGIPLGATNIQHLVIGREGNLEENEVADINRVLTGFEQGVTDGIDAVHKLDAEIALERA